MRRLLLFLVKRDGGWSPYSMQKTFGDAAPREGELLTGSLFSEPMRVETVRSTGRETWVLGLVGVNSERFPSVTLTAADVTSTEQAMERRRAPFYPRRTKDCFIFNFVATNTIEGKVLQKLLERLQEIRDALDDDAVFKVIGEILPAAQIERVLRDYYAGAPGEGDLEDRVRDVKEDRFRAITQNALEGLATKKLNLEMLVERRARAQERRLVPETTARFMAESARIVPLTLKPLRSLPHSFEPGPTPQTLRAVEREPGWKGAALATRYPRISTDRETADKNSLEWVKVEHDQLSGSALTPASSRGAHE